METSLQITTITEKCETCDFEGARFSQRLSMVLNAVVFRSAQNIRFSIPRTKLRLLRQSVTHEKKKQKQKTKRIECK